ncbi:MAG: hypothetical protein Q4G71_03835 [Pseudomonadota bacterium]|nr:hypothetical protein [Pseudomonadota bacterium]
MKSFEQIARAMHAAFIQQAATEDDGFPPELYGWDSMCAEDRACWIAAARQAAAELAEVQ